ncbi:MAG: hypothetical protein HQK51_09775 [Oligoflexia bacterium]|nr:hypothetical protein [Oligoflexia bacterium]
MKISLLMIIMIIISSFFIFHSSFSFASYKDLTILLAKIDQAEANKLPRTAIDLAKQLEKKAKSENEYGIYIRAKTKKIINSAYINGDQAKERIRYLLKELKKEPTENQSILKAILAIWFTNYYQQNSYKFKNRTAINNATYTNSSDEDFLDWDLTKIQSEIIKLFSDALKDELRLKNISINKYRGLIEAGNIFSSKNYSLYDFLLREHINFYSNFSSKFSSINQDEVEIQSSSVAFTNYNNFINLKADQFPNTPYKKALLLYQDLLKYYKNKNDKEMFLDAELARLNFLKEKGVGDEKLEIIQKHLISLISEFKSLKTSTYAQYQLSLIYSEQDNQDNLVKALEVCNKAIVNFKDSDGAKLCRNQINNITQKTFTADTENIIDKFNQKINLHYKNINEINFKIVKDDWDSYLKQKWSNLGDNLNEEQLNKLINQKAEAEWSIKLPATKDYKIRSESIDLPKLAYGFYKIFISENKDFNSIKKNNNQVIYLSFWYTDTTLLIRTMTTDTTNSNNNNNNNSNQQIQGLVIDSIDGKPLKDKSIILYKRNDNKDGTYDFFKSTSSDKNGSFIFEGDPLGGDYALKVESKNSGEVAFHNNLYLMGKNSNRSSNSYFQSLETTKYQTVLFTDRSIYRPGQRIQFKAICLKINAQKDLYQTDSCKNVTVRLYDQNRREIAKIIKSANEWGSFSGDFIIPDNILNGSMNISTEKPSGQTTIQVEEYKRPKFEVILKPSQKEFTLNNNVEAEGSAISYTGIPIANAKVKYRVTRRVIRHSYYSESDVFQKWSLYNKKHLANFLPTTITKEIANGHTTTDNNGNFKVEFTAVPDLSINKKLKPIFNYNLDVQIVDSTGETRENNKSYNFGYVSMKTEMIVPDWCMANQEFNLKVKTSNLDNVPINSSGKIFIYSLKGPQKPQRNGDYKNWELDKEISSFDYQTQIAETAVNEIPLKLKVGAYRAILKTKDKWNNQIEDELNFIILPQKNEKFNIPLPSILKIKNAGYKAEVGSTLEAIWASGYEDAEAYISLIKGNKILKSYWSSNSNKDNLNFHYINFDISEKHIGGLTLQVYFVHENQTYIYSQFIDIPRPNKTLKISWETFRNKIKPNENEMWSLKISKPLTSNHNNQTNHNNQSFESFVAEMVATLYDQSLDSFKAHNFTDLKNYFSKDVIATNFSSNLINKDFHILYSNYQKPYIHVERIYPSFTNDLKNQFQILFPFQPRNLYSSMSMKKGLMKAQDVLSPMTTINNNENSNNEMKEQVPTITTPNSATITPTIRKNFQETVFFFPHLVSDSNGTIKINFIAPETLSKWKFMALAHGKNLESGLISDEIITQKELMITPNTPRFIRQGDKIQFNVKVSNNSEKNQKGSINLNFFNILNEENVTAYFIKSNNSSKEFELAANQSQNFSFEINVPDVTYPVSYRFLAKSETFSDGEESIITILPRNIFVDESFPLWISGSGKMNFKWKKLSDSYKSKTLKHQKLIVQIVSNPIWYAVLALPYLEQSPVESSDQIFNRFYANTIASFILNSNPNFQNIFEEWKKNQKQKQNQKQTQSLPSANLANIANIAETPWYADALTEENTKNNISIFFDKNRIRMETQNALEELNTRVLSDGNWPWFNGGPKNEYITQYILSGFGKLKQLGINIHPNMNTILKSVLALDKWVNEQYKTIEREQTKKENHYTSNIAFYLYTRSFFLQEIPIAQEYNEAINYYISQAEKHWNKTHSRMSEAHTALALARFKKNNKNPTSVIIIQSLRERAKHSKELGMFWEESPFCYFWYQAPIETQVIMIELFKELDLKQKEIDELNIWLLKQKQTHAWKTNKATANVVWTLLNQDLDNHSKITKPNLVEVTIGNQKITPNLRGSEAGSGFYQKSFDSKEITSMTNSAGDIELYKKDKGISWGGVFWHYFEDISKVTAHKTPLELKKKIFVKRFTKKGPKLFPVISQDKEALDVGDTIVIRINLNVDRDMEFIEMKDMRASGTEPTTVLSQYKFQDGLNYYQSTKDTATYFYFDYLPKGTYVFEYELRIFQKGSYQTGITEIKSLYAPEFSSHSESILLKTK